MRKQVDNQPAVPAKQLRNSERRLKQLTRNYCLKTTQLCLYSWLLFHEGTRARITLLPLRHVCPYSPHTHIVKEVAKAVNNRETQPPALFVQYTANIVTQISTTTMLYKSSQEQFLRLPVLTFWHHECRRCSILRCYTVRLSKHIPMPRRIAVPPPLGSSSPYSSSLLGMTVPEHQEIRIQRNAGNSAHNETT